MRRTVYLLLASGLGILGVLCGGCSGKSSPTEAEIAKNAPPAITNLSNTATAAFDGTDEGRRIGTLPIGFDYTDPDGDLDQVIVTFPEGPAQNPLQGVAGKTSGHAGLLQTVLLPASGTKVVFTVQVSDKAGHLSNVLFGNYTAP